MFDYTKLYRYKQNSTAIFLGSGSSINRITGEEWEAIMSFDVWTVNNWIYHPVVVPNFYHIEVKHYNYNLMASRVREKQGEYADVNFIFPRGKSIKMRNGWSYSLHAVVPDQLKKFDYDMIGRDPKRTDSPFTASYKLKEERIVKSYDMSLTSVFELMYKMGYEKIVTFGIDLSDSLYFWTGGDPKYGDVHHQTNKAHENKDPMAPHSTHKIKDFIVDFSERRMKPKGKGIFVGHKDTLLYPELPFVSVRNL